MSIGFSLVFYHTSYTELGKQLPQHSVFDDGLYYQFGVNQRLTINDFMQQRINEGRKELLISLVALNVVALVVGSYISYYLARRTLKPIEQAFDAQNRFVSDASHELRTPLTSIQTGNEVALKRPKLSLDEAKEIIQDNIDNVVKLKKLTDGLLSLAKQDEQGSVVSPVSIQQVVSEAMNQVINSAQSKDINVNDSVPDINVLGNEVGLTQVVVILLDNAIKYSPDKSNIYLEGYKKGDSGFISVRDEGIGIRLSDIPHVFSRFYRADNSRTNNQHHGYGLGLSIAQKIIVQNHGEISVVSTKGKGSTFTIKLPSA